MQPVFAGRVPPGLRVPSRRTPWDSPSLGEARPPRQTARLGNEGLLEFHAPSSRFLVSGLGIGEPFRGYLRGLVIFNNSDEVSEFGKLSIAMLLEAFRKLSKVLRSCGWALSPSQPVSPDV